MLYICVKREILAAFRHGSGGELVKKILLVDDDTQMLDVMRRHLETCGFSIIYTNNGSEALILARESKPDLIVSDVEMNGLDGFALCKALKYSPETAAIPVILISGVSIKDDDVLSGHIAGCDDYVVKPFALPVLAAKISTVLRRYSVVPVLSVLGIRGQKFELDPASRTVKICGKPVMLTRKEFDLLVLMIEKKGRLLNVPYILETVWGYDIANYNDPSTVQTHFSTLRKKLGPKLASKLVSVTGHGYKFDSD